MIDLMEINCSFNNKWIIIYCSTFIETIFCNFDDK